ncbi:conserved hypothetical protein [Tenacibaculum maritimum]|uniref:hypothetical protein n=1 Tax=Tenacibaculum maritimum TaxID=107401 RepID=UPI0012E6722C|nr:hypothetical protein [Tenacibaculum maritimum]CAA0163003.1 conserved hypothetical protein [Tenacibaculum maritimum]
MKANFIAYYLPVFGTSIGMMFPVFLLNHKAEERLEMLVSMFTLAIIITILVGTYYYKYGDSIRFRDRKRALKKQLFTKFIETGFGNNNVSVSGYIDNYYCIISSEKELLDHQRWIEIMILFNPKQEQQYISRALFERLYKLNKRQYTWNSNSLIIKKVYGIKFPVYETILKEIEEALQILKKHRISSICEAEWDLTIEESLINYHQTSRLKE